MIFASYIKSLRRWFVTSQTGFSLQCAQWNQFVIHRSETASERASIISAVCFLSYIRHCFVVNADRLRTFYNPLAGNITSFRRDEGSTLLRHISSSCCREMKGSQRQRTCDLVLDTLEYQTCHEMFNLSVMFPNNQSVWSLKCRSAQGDVDKLLLFVAVTEERTWEVFTFTKIWSQMIFTDKKKLIKWLSRYLTFSLVVQN